MPASTASGTSHQRGREQQHEQQRQRVHDAGHGRLRARADVGRRARDRARRGQSAHERRQHVGDALRGQLDVGIVPVARHAIGDRGGHERFDRSQHGHREHRWQQRHDQVEPEGRDVKCRQARGDAAEARADGLHVEAEPAHGQRAEHERQDRARNAFHVALHEQHQHERAHAERGGHRRPRAERVADLDHARQEHAGRLLDVQSEQVADLRAGDEQRDAVREPDHDRPRQEAHRGAQPGEAHHHKRQARK
jgi:hypothetical protein